MRATEEPFAMIRRRTIRICLVFICVFSIQSCLSEDVYSPELRIFSNKWWKTQRISHGLAVAADTPGISNSPGSIVPYFDGRVSDLIAQNVLRFAHDIGKQLNNESLFSKSEVFSPVSIMSALALLMLGSKGKSYQELNKLFGIDNDSELMQNPSKFYEELANMLDDLQQNDTRNLWPNRENTNWRSTTASNNVRNTVAERNKPFEHLIKIANGLFTQSGYNLNPDYRDVVNSLYRSELLQLDFQRQPSEARDYINAWVDANTFGKIPSIIGGEIDRETNIIIASVLYFKGFWENSFFESATALENFYPDGRSQPPIRVKMMATGGVFPYYESKEYDCNIIGLPYKGNVTTMYVIQPNQSSRVKLRNLQHILNAQIIEGMISQMVRKSTVMVFPKMHFVRSVHLRNLLKRLGVNDIFSSTSSDLSLIDVPRYQQYQPPAPVVDRYNEYQQHAPIVDRYNEKPLIFSRFGNTNDTTNPEPQTQSATKSKRSVDTTKRDSLQRLEVQRYSINHYKSDLFVDDIFHKVDFDVHEHGTEAAAATLTYLRRSGTDVTFRGDAPFLILIRHDPTKLPLFYGVINEPVL